MRWRVAKRLIQLRRPRGHRILLRHYDRYDGHKLRGRPTSARERKAWDADQRRAWAVVDPPFDDEVPF